ncbi:putative quorum-sensing-regulated virulence factor [Ochrobactrum phage vB_OspM_OC]|nr:putative quorum-sensing-regulated virulence factor [Ochrobactrum phage vB_OspM_OC]
MAKVFLQVFVSTGRKNAMFTLRTMRIHDTGNFSYSNEAYIKNLSTDAEKAEELAIEYAKALNDRIGSEDYVVEYVGMETDEIIKRRGKLSAKDTVAIEAIENGIVPYGKYKGQAIADLTDGYLLWLTDTLSKMDKDSAKPAFFALCSVASGIAHERGLIAEREQKRFDRFHRDSMSNHFGVIGGRYEMNVVVEFKKKDEYSNYFKYQMRIGNDILFHNGNADLPLGECRLKFTVKFHNETQKGIKKTYINRPTLIQE